MASKSHGHVSMMVIGTHARASPRENKSLRIRTRLDSNKPAQLVTQGRGCKLQLLVLEIYEVNEKEADRTAHTHRPNSPVIISK